MIKNFVELGVDNLDPVGFSDFGFEEQKKLSEILRNVNDDMDN